MHLLFVCTGNLCRSPMAERLSRLHLGPTSPIAVSSAGLRAMDGLPMDALSAAALRELGGSDEGFASRCLSAGLLQRADLVLTMTHRQRDAVLAHEPGALHRTFVLSEAAALVESIPEDAMPPVDDRSARAVALAAGRTRRAGRPTGDPDIGDPIGRRLDVHRAVIAQLDALLRPILALVGGPDAVVSGSAGLSHRGA